MIEDDEPETTGNKQALTQFKPGQSGNPKGRPKGSRNRLGEDFLAAMQHDFEEHGKAAIETVRKERPQDYLKVIASILPKELHVKVDPLEELSDAELDRRIRQLATALRLEVGTGSGVDNSEAPAGTEQTGGVSSVH